MPPVVRRWRAAKKQWVDVSNLTPRLIHAFPAPCASRPSKETTMTSGAPGLPCWAQVDTDRFNHEGIARLKPS